MPKTTIYYLNVLPGVGKTTWAITEMCLRMQAKELITLYVAPTLNLLKQVRNDLLALAETQMKSPQKLIRLIESESNSGGYGSWMSVSEKLHLSLEGGTSVFDGKGIKPRSKAPLGTIIFITHEAFLKRAKIDKTNVAVIFDEARKFVTRPEEIMLKSPEEEKWFSKLLVEGSVPLSYSDGTPTEFNKVVRAKIPKTLNKKLKSTDARLQFKEITAITTIIKNPDIDLYVSTNEKKWRRTKFRFHQVVIPTNIFIGFKEVILMSAFLKDSQMWHFLELNPDVELVDIQLEGPYVWAVNRSIFQRSKQIKNKLTLVTIIPLTRQNNLTSITRYDNGLLVPEHAEFILKLALEKEGYTDTKDVLRLLNSRDHLVLTPKIKRVLTMLDEYGVKQDAFDWYCQTALKVVNNLAKAGKIKRKPLAVANVKGGRDIYVRTNYPQFEVIPLSNQGMNIYQKHNCMFFSAALNPDRESQHLYRALLPKYNFALDHVAEACVQSATRLSIRDTSSTQRNYIIVPDLAMANLLRQKLRDEPSINMEVANCYQLTAFTNLNKARVSVTPRVKFETTEQKQSAIKDKHVKWRKENLSLARLRSRRNYYLKQLEIDGSNAKAKSRIEDLDREIKDLLAKKSKQK